MHFLLYVCLPTDKAATSLQARRRVCRYLNEEHFVRDGRFSVNCDYFSVGGRYSGMLNLLRLKHQNPQVFKRYLAKHKKASEPQEAQELFKRSFPYYNGMIPVFRTKVRYFGSTDDAQIIDKILFAELRSGFNEYGSAAIGFKKPNVIFTDLCKDEWPVKPADANGRHWVVVIDYHD